MAEIVPFPPAQDVPRQRDMVEVGAAIALVVAGVATSVRLINLSDPMFAAGEGAAQASAAGVDFRIERRDEHIAIVIGARR